jgi:hypothetical protein
MPTNSFTGLATKARVNVVATACYENTRKEGGTVQAISELVYLGLAGRTVEVIDLTTGEHTSDETLTDLGPGTYIFWACLNKVMYMTKEERTRVHLTVVEEPGKARAVTKGSAFVKVVLDVVSKLCAWPLARGVDSSRSGMLAANHPWNFFLSLFTEEKKHLTFPVIQKTRKDFARTSVETTTFGKLFMSSTDFKEATDKVQHQIAKLIGQTWMVTCGIPVVLRAIVTDICYNERTVHFTATGPLKRIGLPGEEDIRQVTLKTGLLMGDPLTKVVLHLINACSRKLGQGLLNAEFLNDISANPSTVKQILMEHAP